MSRIPPNSADSRFPRDRSSPRYERRDGRPSETGFDRSDSYVGRGGPPREPPRGPKAQVGRGSFIPRGRGFGSRADGRDRDFREDVHGRGRGRGHDWDPRDRVEARDRRASPPLRARSRSPYREPRTTDPALRRRNSRDGQSVPTDALPSRGRGIFRGRGRGDWDSGRGRSFLPEDRFEQRSRSRDRVREHQSRDYSFDSSRRDDDQPFHRGRNRDDRPRSEQTPYRPDSRNSYGASRSTSTTSLQPNMAQDLPQSSHLKQEPFQEVESKPTVLETRFKREQADWDIDRKESLHQRIEHERSNARASSPPPIPSVPAFGSILPQTSTVNDGAPKSAASKDDEPQIHPSRRALLNAPKENSVAPSNVLDAPTAPKAQQRIGPEEPLRSGTNIPLANIWAREPPREPISNWSKRFSQTNAPTALRAPEQPSVRKALEEEGRNGHVPSASSGRPSSSEPFSQTSPMKIPTGPRAARAAAPSIRQTMQPSIRAPITNRGAPSIMGRGQRQPSTRVWTNPNLHHTAPRGPSIMNKVPTRRGLEHGGERSNSSSSVSAVEQWRLKNVPQSSSNVIEDEKLDEQEEDEDNFSDDNGPKSIADHEERYNLGSMPDEVSKNVSEDEAISDNEIDMGLNDADIQKAQRNHEKDLKRLEAKRPRTPNCNPVLLDMLEELEILAIAIRESSAGIPGITTIDGAKEPARSPLAVEAILKQEDEGNMNPKSEHESDEESIGSMPGTPPLDKLPFLRDASPTPFSEIEELQTPRTNSDDVEGWVHLKLQEDQDLLSYVDYQARSIFIQSFHPWRRETEAMDEAASGERAEHAHEASTPPELVPEATSVPQSVRGRRLVSDYGLDAVIQESERTAAREEEARRLRDEREAQVYVPADAFVPEREAVIPAMLNEIEAQSTRFLDYNDHVAAEHVLEALRYVPPKDTFTKKEHQEFISIYVTMPKRFGGISEKLRHRSYKDCVRHYYSSKKSTDYKKLEFRFYKTQKGKKFKEANDRAAAAGSRLRGSLLGSFDGALDQEAQNATLTESGRPRRAAAPTFGEASEPEPLVMPAMTPVRRPTIGKENIVVPMISAEKPTARRVKTATGQKPGRKPKGQPLLAAAPAMSQAPSPLKAASENLRPSIEEPIPDLGRVDDHEAAQLLANMPASLQRYAAPQASYTKDWVSGQIPVVAASAPAPPSQPATMPAQESPIPHGPDSSQPLANPRPQQTPETTSYWSVPEKQDFINYVGYFGTNWQKIASTMKTKTTQMIKNHYLREIDPKKGEKGKNLEQSAKRANEMITRNEDMGPIPDPTPVQPKRRYDPHASRDSQRPLAPSVDLTMMGDDSPSLRPTKSQMSPPHIASTTARFSTSSQAEQKAAASSAQVLAQGPQSPANRGVLHMQHAQQRPQSIQTPSLSSLTENRARPVAQARPLAAEGTRQEDFEQGKVRIQQQQPPPPPPQQRAGPQEHEQWKQDELELRRHLELRQREMEVREQAAQAQLRRQHLSHQQPLAPLTREPQTLALNENNVPQVEFDERSRRIFEQRYGHEIPRSRQEEAPRPPDAFNLNPHGIPPSAMQQALSGTLGASQRRHNPSQSPSISNLAMPSSSRMEPPRPSSVPAVVPAAVPPQPAALKKTSNIMSLLNSEPEEPKVSKRLSDPRGGASTPDLLAQSRQYQAASRPVPQQFARPETPSQLAAQQSRHITIDQQLKQQPRQDLSLRGGGSVREITPSMHRSSLDERQLQSSRSSMSQPYETPFLPSSSSRPGLLPIQRDRAPVSPPPLHSRTSSYSSMSQAVQQSQQPHSQEHRPSMSQATVDSRLRPSPWANITPPQHDSVPRFPPPPQQQYPQAFNSQPQRERDVRAEEHRRSLESQSQEIFQRQLQQRQQFTNRPPSHEDLQALERQEIERDPGRYAQFLQSRQQEAMEQEMRERRRNEEELHRRQHHIQPHHGEEILRRQQQQRLEQHRLEEQKRVAMLHDDERFRNRVERERGAPRMGFYPQHEERR